jgi:hypothetical protein
MAFDLIEKVFAQTGVSEQIVVASRTCSSVTFQAKRGNSNACQIAPETFVTGKGYELVKPTADEKLPEKEFTSPGREGINLSTWYGMGTAGEGINIIIEEF